MSQFEYISVLISIIVGLALTQLLRGLGRLVVIRNGPQAYWVHLVWTLYFFMNTVMFWWWEFRLEQVVWSLGIYLVIIIYAMLLFFVSVVIQPTQMAEVQSYKDYYYLNRRWIFGLLIALVIWDFVDTLAKSVDHFFELGIEYIVAQMMLLIASFIAFMTANEHYHEAFAAVWIIVYVAFMVQINYVIG